MSIEVCPKCAAWLPADHRRSISALAEHLGMDLNTHRKRTKVCQATLTNGNAEPVDVYFKVYATRVRPGHGFGRKSRALVEARNLQYFRQWGIPTPEIVAWGSERRLGGLCSDLSFIMTRAVPEAPSLKFFWPSLDVPTSADLRRALIDQLAEQTRVLHSHGFYHQDLKWRNLLVDGNHQLTWIDCPSGYRSRFSPRQRHGRIKDLATLDLRAHVRCTDSERRRFLEIYLATTDAAMIRAWASAVTRYRVRRFKRQK